MSKPLAKEEVHDLEQHGRLHTQGMVLNRPTGSLRILRLEGNREAAEFIAWWDAKQRRKGRKAVRRTVSGNLERADVFLTYLHRSKGVPLGDLRLSSFKDFDKVFVHEFMKEREEQYPGGVSCYYSTASVIVKFLNREEGDREFNTYAQRASAAVKRERACRGSAGGSGGQQEKGWGMGSDREEHDWNGNEQWEDDDY
jgi:hypothetical protein